MPCPPPARLGLPRLESRPHGHPARVELRPRSHSAQRSRRRASARPRPGTGTRPGGSRAGRVRAGDRRAAEHPARAAAAGAARGRRHPRVRHGRRRPGGRRGAEPLAGRRARGRDLLPRPAPHSPGRAPGRPVPRRGLPGARSRGPVRRGLRPLGRVGRRRGGRGLLPRAVRGRAVGHRRRCAARGAVGRSARRPHRQVVAMTTAWVPCDAAAVALGADAVADAIAAAGVTVRRNGSRGLLWLEPLVEVETERGRVGYGNLTEAEVGPLLDGALDGTERCIGVVDEHEWLAAQHRVSFARVGVIEPTDLAAYREHGGLRGLERAVALAPDEVVAEVTASGLRGRGGAGFPAGIKWETVRTAPSDVKFVCCNADEGDSGTFADRMLIEGDPFTLVEGMTIAALAVGATEGYVYLRSEYPDAVATLKDAIGHARDEGWLGPDILGSGFGFDLHVRVGAGAYICGEET